MKIKKKERLTALLLCAVMIATTIMSNSAYVFAADKAEGTSGLEDKAITSDGAKETPDGAAAVPGEENQVTDGITEPETTPTEAPKAEEEVPAKEKAPVTEEPVVSDNPAVAEEPVTTAEGIEEPVAQTLYTFEDDDMFVEVQLPEGTVLPEGTELNVRQITDHKITKKSTEEEKADKARFDDITNLLKDVTDDNGNPVDGFYAYHAELVKDGEVYVPEGEMNVKVSYKNGALPEIFTGDSKLKVMNVKALNYTTVKDEKDQDKTVVQDLKDQLTAFMFADDTIGSVQEIGFNAGKLTDFIVAWNGQDQTTEYTYSDDEVTMKATVSQAGILPRGVELKAAKVEDEAALKQTEDLLVKNADENKKELAGFKAYDIRFEKDGEEYEPEGSVNVEIQFANAVKPDGDIKDTEAVFYHLNEAAEGNSLEVQSTAASIEADDEKAVSKVSFKTESFSVYSLAWEKQKEEKVLLKAPSGSSSASMIPTADSRADGIEINLYDYKSKINSGDYEAFKKGFFFYNSGNGVDGKNDTKENNGFTNSGKQGLLQGILKKNLDGGIPLLNYDAGISMKYLIQGSNAVESHTGLDGLFQRNNDGYYYYNSIENHAQLNGDRLDIYNATLSPDTSTESLNHGNFLPFNKLPDGTSEGALASVAGGRKNTDYWFGMNVNMNFYQPADGKINGKDMTFNFEGDDDVWVYIDGILVLDIGGIHSSLGGSINFGTGAVTSGDTQTTLREAFIEAYIERQGTQSGLDTYINNIFTEEGVFKNFSSHSMQFFYLERGAGASNCKIEFNMRPLPKDSVTIEKEISNYDSGAYSDTEFSFKLYEKIGDKYEVLADTDYTLTLADGITKEKLTTDKDGVFKLKHKEQAQFADIEAGTKYYVEEIGLNSAEYDQVEIESTEIVNEDDVNVGNSTTKRTKELMVGENNFVNFKNRCAATNLKQLVIEKKMAGSTDQNIFQMLVTIGGEPYVGKYKAGDNEVAANAGTEQSTADGIITLKAGQTAVILGNAQTDDKRGIPSGTSFKVEEVDLDQDAYCEPQYQVVNQDSYKADDVASEDGYEGYASGVINIEGNAKVVVTNFKGAFEFSLMKTDSGDAPLSGAEFAVYTADGKTKLQSVRSGDDGIVTFKGLKSGEYVITEEKAPEGYLVSGEKWKLTISHEGVAKLDVAENIEVGKLNGVYRIHNYTQTETIENSIEYEKTAKVENWDDRTYNIAINADSKKVVEGVTTEATDIVLLLDSSESMHYANKENRVEAKRLGKYQEKANELNTSKIYYYSLTETAQSVGYSKADKFEPLKYIDGKWMRFSGEKTGWQQMTSADKGTVYIWENRMSELKNAASNFINSIAATAPGCNVSILTFDSNVHDLTDGFLNVKENKTELVQKANEFTLIKNTRHDLALEAGQEQLKTSDSENKFVVLFTDGELWWKDGNAAQIKAAEEATTATAAEIKNTKGASIYTIGLALTEERSKWLEGIATPGMAYDTSTMEGLEGIFQSISSGVSDSVDIIGADIRDVIDPRFDLLDDKGEVITADRIEAMKKLGKSGVELVNGGIVDIDEDGNLYVVWKDQTITHASGNSHGWSKSITVKAKDEFIGGNNVETNVANGSEIIVPGIPDPLPLDQPTVNVKVDTQIGNLEDTIFWGDKVPEIGDKLSQMFDVENVTGSYAQNTKDKKYTIGRDGTPLKAEDFTLTWSKNTDFAKTVTMEQILEEMPEVQTAYYLKAQYNKNEAATAESKANTTDASGKVHVAEEDNGLLASNNKDGLSKDNEKYYGGKYGVYLMNVVKGQLKIEKEIDSQYTDISKINANQSFVFCIDRREKTDGDIKDTYYAVLSFDANGDVVSGTDTITGLKKGYYTITEETKWSPKYSLTKTSDNYAGNGSTSGQNLFIGDNDPKVVKDLKLEKGQKAFYGTASGYEAYAPEYPAAVAFKNTLKSDWQWLSDTAAAVNKFTGKN